jgi:Bacterial archaeo-eukaryotic release factor family 2
VDIQTLTSLYHRPFDDGPVVTVYLDTQGNVEKPAEKLDLRWKDVLRELEEAGVAPATRDALTQARGPRPHKLGDTRALVAADGEVLLAASLPEPPESEMVRVASLPYLLPLVRWLEEQVPHVVVRANRTGADIVAYVADAEPAESEKVDAERYPIHKTGRGGWAQLRYEHKVEENWKKSEKEIAAEVAKAANDIDARLIIAAGDVITLEGLAHLLPERLQPRYRVIDGGRGEDGSDELVAQRVRATVEAFLDGERTDLLADWVMYRNRAAKLAHSPEFRGDSEDMVANASDGPKQTVAALQRAQVATLLLTAELEPETPAWYGPQPTDVSLDREELQALNVAEPRQAALVDVLLRAALGTDAAVRTVPVDLDTHPLVGVGALLRFSPPPTA